MSVATKLHYAQLIAVVAVVVVVVVDFKQTNIELKTPELTECST